MFEALEAPERGAIDDRAVAVRLIPLPYQSDLTMYGNDVMDLTSFGLRSI
jgi:hypothetical protein